MSAHTKDPFVWIKDNSLSKEFCDNLITKFNQNSHLNTEGMTISGEVNRIKQSKDCHISSHMIYRDEDEVFFNSLSDSLSEYDREVSKRLDLWHFSNNFVKCDFSSGLPTQDTGYQMQKTEPDEFYDWHHDWIFHNDGSRTLTYIWYLNDIDEGGYTEFQNGDKIQPVTGRLLLFPATWTYIHRGFPPKNKTKYIVTGWLLNKV